LITIIIVGVVIIVAIVETKERHAVGKAAVMMAVAVLTVIGAAILVCTAIAPPRWAAKGATFSTPAQHWTTATITFHPATAERRGAATTAAFHPATAERGGATTSPAAATTTASATTAALLSSGDINGER